MKPTDFAHHLGKYLGQYLVNEKGSSPRTVDSYRHTFLLYLQFMESEMNVGPQRIALKHFTHDSVVAFLNWLEQERGNKAVSRNQRLAALRSFARYLMGECPDHLDEYQKIRAIAMKKSEKREISYLKTDGMKLLVGQVNRHAPNGLRDLLILMLMYTVGLRVSEVVHLRVEDLHFDSPSTIVVHGKGGKKRLVPLMTPLKSYMVEYLKRMGYGMVQNAAEPLFKDHMRQPIGRHGIAYVVRKYATMARKIRPDLIPKDLSPHKLRHTAAMALLASGVDLIYIRNLLGHASVKTTEIYARANTEVQRKAIEAAARNLVPSEEAKWEADKNIKEWLKSFRT